MIVYNVSIKVQEDIAGEWVQWIKGGHAQEVVDTGMFSHFSFFELVEPYEEGAKTFVIQYFTDSEEKYNRYISEFAPKLRQDGLDRFKDKFVGFRTKLMQLS